MGKNVTAIAVPESQWVEILKNHSSEKNAESTAEMFKGFNSEHIVFERENQIAGTVTIEDFAREAMQ